MIFDIEENKYNFDPYNVLLAIAPNIPAAYDWVSYEDVWMDDTVGGLMRFSGSSLRSKCPAPAVSGSTQNQLNPETNMSSSQSFIISLTLLFAGFILLSSGEETRQQEKTSNSETLASTRHCQLGSI